MPELLKAVQRGKDRRFGTLKGKVKIIDPNWAAPMTVAEADAFIEGRY